MKTLLSAAVVGAVLAACGSDTPEMAPDDCEALKVACGGNWLVGTNCEEPMRRACIVTAPSCGSARWCGMGPVPDSGMFPAITYEERICGFGCRGCSSGDEARCDAACVAGPIQDCINRSLSCALIEDCLAP